ncbi:hypothetical protein IEQ34_005403 [Dendrobium chrysotoxum]|uniref:Uncharacterized protein n=1 Tax=Dendrobium chrysotoxum TaxID=161865 RepID=A0AAV7GTU1_DENCH|nr:hypothetical protein IEQ34_005403 [Dendrobium chrysotoxum]
MAVDEGLRHGDKEKPLGVGDLLLHRIVRRGPRGTAGDQGVQFTKHTLPVLLLRRGGSRVHLPLLLPFLAALVIPISPAKKVHAGANVIGRLPEYRIGPALSTPLDQHLEPLLQGLLGEISWRGGDTRHAGERRRIVC